MNLTWATKFAFSACLVNANHLNWIFTKQDILKKLGSNLLSKSGRRWLLDNS